MSKDFQQAAEEAIAQIVAIAEEKGEPEQVDLVIYQDEASLRRAGVLELSLEEHREMVLYINQRLEDLGFETAVHLSPVEP